MNTRLEQLFEQYNISPKNRYEINQFFWLIPNHKKQNLLNNFEVLAIKLFQIEEEIKIEREILIWNALDNIKKTIEFVKKEEFKNKVKGEIDSLKKWI